MASTIRKTITIDIEFNKQLMAESEKQQRSFSNQLVYLAKKGRELTELKTVKGE